MKNENGFTLVELIIVVALMGIIGSFIGLTYGAVSGQNAKTAAKDVYNMLGSAQTVAMSKDECKYILYVNSDDKIEISIVNGHGGILDQKECSSGVTFSAVCGTDKQYGKGEGIVLSFDRATGSIKKTYQFTGDYKNPLGAEITNCSQIVIGTGSRKQTINVYASTGKFELIK